MRNLGYRDPATLRRDVVALITTGRFEFSYHAEKEHPEIPLEDKLRAVLYGEGDRPNEASGPGRPSYVCWYDHERLGLLRGVYAILEGRQAAEVLIITVFQE